MGGSITTLPAGGPVGAGEDEWVDEFGYFGLPGAAGGGGGAGNFNYGYDPLDPTSLFDDDFGDYGGGSDYGYEDYGGGGDYYEDDYY